MNYSRLNDWVYTQRVFRIYRILQRTQKRHPQALNIIENLKKELEEAKTSTWENLRKCRQERTVETMAFMP